VVATPIACAGLEAKHGEHLWVAKDTEGFVKGIIILLRDADLRRRLGRNGRRLVEEKYSWEVAVAKQIQVYMDVLKSKGRFT